MYSCFEEVDDGATAIPFLSLELTVVSPCSAFSTAVVDTVKKRRGNIDMKFWKFGEVGKKSISTWLESHFDAYYSQSKYNPQYCHFSFIFLLRRFLLLLLVSPFLPYDCDCYIGPLYTFSNAVTDSLE